jgi:hypothetical protein
LILLLKLDTPSSYTQKEISHEHVLQTRFRILKKNEYFVSSRPAGSCSGLNRQPLSTAFKQEKQEQEDSFVVMSGTRVKFFGLGGRGGKSH